MAGVTTVTATTAFVAFVDGAYVVVHAGDEYKSSDPLVKLAPTHFTTAPPPRSRAQKGS